MIFLPGLLIILLIIIGAGIYYYAIARFHFSDTELETAQKALENGVIIEDDQGDFIGMEGKEENGSINNSEPYELPYMDIKSLSISSDEKYLYIKEEFWGKIPKGTQKYNEDNIKDFVMKVNLVDENGEDETVIVTGISFLPFFTSVGQYCMTDATGIEFPEEKRFGTKVASGRIYGKPGNDYIISAIPLEDINLKAGQIIYVTGQSEAESGKYGHASIDVLRGPGGKDAAIFKIDLSTNQYSEVEKNL